MARRKTAAKGTELSNPFSTGGGGAAFENHVQAAFVVLMLTGGIVPCLPHWPLVKIKLQGKYQGFQTDDFIAFVGSEGKQAKLLAKTRRTTRHSARSSRRRGVTFRTGSCSIRAWTGWRLFQAL
jgi:hypothetical protein